MDFKREAVINKPVEEVWEVLGKQFGNAHRWAASLNHSEGYGKPTLEGASCNNRVCDTTQGNIKEVLRKLDHQNHVLAYQVIEGFPFFVDTAINTWTLTPKGEQATQLHMHCEMKMKGVVGAVMSPMMKWQLNTLFDEVMEEFKYYVEHDGQPHPRKAKAQQKLARKTA